MPLQKPFRGLSNFLGLFNAGALSFEIPNVIAPVLDVSDFTEPLSTEWSGTGQLSIDGSSFSITVPENERWRMRFMASTFGSATKTGTLQHVLKKPVIANSFAISDSKSVSAFGPDNEIGIFSDLQGMILDGGDRIGIKFIIGSGTGNMNVEFIVQFQRIKV